MPIPKINKFFSPVLKKLSDLQTVYKSQRFLGAAENVGYLKTSPFKSPVPITTPIYNFNPSEMLVYGRHYIPNDIRGLSYFMETVPHTKRYGRTVKQIEPGKAWYIDTYPSKSDATRAITDLQTEHETSTGLKSATDVMRQIGADSKYLSRGNRVELILNYDLSKDSYPLYLKTLQRNHNNGVGLMEPVIDNNTFRMIALNNYGMNPKSIKRIDATLDNIRTTFNLPDLPGRVSLFGKTFVPAFRFTKFKIGGTIKNLTHYANT